MCLGFRDSNASLIDVLKSVIKPSVESIGVKLFKQMKRNLRNNSNYSESKVYGCEKPSNTSNKSLNSELPFCLYEPKSDFHGIGYKGINSENNSYESKSSSGVSAVLSSGRKLNISGEAFGYGVLEEDNEEDAVVYHKDDMSQYDFAIGTVRERVNDKKTDKHKAIDLGKTDIIEGFVKCLTKTNLMEIIAKKYPIPVLPPNWRPSSYSGVTKLKKSRSRWDQTHSQSDSTNSDNSNTTVPSKPPVLNANIRAVLLGQEIIHRQGVKLIDKVEPIDSSMISPKVSSIENKVKEIVIEREKISIAQKPLTGFWANKFTRSDKIEDNTLTGGLTEFNSKQSDNREKLEEPPNDTNAVIERTIYEWHPHNLLCRRFNIPNPYPQYPDVVGIVTVGKTDVRNRTSQMTAKKNKPNIFECLFHEPKVSIEPKSNEEVVQDLSVNSQKEINQTETRIDSINDIVDEENVETTRPPMDLFKAIFASDEEESDDEINNKEENIVMNSESEKLVENTTNTSQMSGTKATGIFANIDFDQLNRNFTPVLKSNDTQKVETNDSQKVETISEINENTDKTNQNDDDFYGPALPPPSSYSNVTNFNININSSELKTKSLKRKKKEKKQRKHKKQSSSHKKHKRHRRSSSSSSSEENLDLKILEYFRK